MTPDNTPKLQGLINRLRRQVEHNGWEEPYISKIVGEYFPTREQISEEAVGWQAFGKEICRMAWEGGDVDGGSVQDLGVKHGVLIEEQYEKDKHGCIDYAEEGDTVYVFASLAAPVATREDVVRHVAILERHDRRGKKAVIVPDGQSLDFDEDGATRRWLRPYLGNEYHLDEFLPLQRAANAIRDAQDAIDYAPAPVATREDVIRECINAIPTSMPWKHYNVTVSALRALSTLLEGGR